MSKPGLEKRFKTRMKAVADTISYFFSLNSFPSCFSLQEPDFQDSDLLAKQKKEEKKGFQACLHSRKCVQWHQPRHQHLNLITANIHRPLRLLVDGEKPGFQVKDPVIQSLGIQVFLINRVRTAKCLGSSDQGCVLHVKLSQTLLQLLNGL